MRRFLTVLIAVLVLLTEAITAQATTYQTSPRGGAYSYTGQADISISRQIAAIAAGREQVIVAHIAHLGHLARMQHHTNHLAHLAQLSADAVAARAAALAAVQPVTTSAPTATASTGDGDSDSDDPVTHMSKTAPTAGDHEPDGDSDDPATQGSVPRAVPASSASSSYAGSGTYSYSQLENLWTSAGGPAWAAAHAAAIAECESGGSASAYNPSGATGVWQILGAVVPGNLTNASVNAANAVSKFNASGQTFAQWVCQ